MLLFLAHHMMQSVAFTHHAQSCVKCFMIWRVLEILPFSKLCRYWNGLSVYVTNTVAGRIALQIPKCVNDTENTV